jgi:TolA-binding protein
MTPSQQQEKDIQDEARREQQADERIRELEEEVEQLRGALLSLLSNSRFVLRSDEPVDLRLWRALSASMSTAEDALDGGGDDHASS